MATTVARLEAILSANTRDFDSAMNKSEGRMKSIGKVAGVAGIAVATGLAVGLEKSIKAALAAQVSQTRLETAFKNAHLQLGPYRKALDAVEASGRKLGFTDEMTKEAIGSLVTATHSARKATSELGIAEDIARFKHVSLIDATKMLTMAQTGSQRAAKQLGITVPPVTAAYDALSKTATSTEKAHAKLQDKMATGNAIIDAVRDHVHGQADAFSKTASGSMEQFHAQLSHIEVAIGNKLIPALTFLLKKTNELIIWFEVNWPQISATVHKVLDPLMPFVRLWGDEIKQIFKIFGALLKGDWSGVWTGIKNIVKDELKAARAAISFEFDLFKRIMTALGNLALEGLKAGLVGVRGLIFAYIINPFKNAISDGADAVKAAVTGLFHKVIHWVKSALGIASPSSVFYEIGKNSILGFIHGVGSMAGVLKDYVVHTAESAVKGLPGAVGGAIGGIGKALGGGISSAPGEHSPGSAQKYLIPWAQQEGIAITSVNTGSHVAGSYHYQNRAIDVSGSAAMDRKFFFDSIGHFGLGNITELFYDPIGFFVKNGRRVSGAIGGHSDHVHIALDRGGWLPTGTNLITNNTGRPERVLGPGEGGSLTVNVHAPGYLGDESALGAAVMDVLAAFQNRNGRPAYGSGF